MSKNGQNMARVAVTGLGMVSSLGTNLKDTWNHIVEGKPGVSEHPFFLQQELPVKIAGYVRDYKISTDLLDEREAPRYDRFIHFALTASKEAFLDAGLSLENMPYPKPRMGCILGVGMGGFPLIEEEHNKLRDKGARRVSPFFIPSCIPNMASGLVSIKLGLQGPNYTISSACASSAHALSAACYDIMSGRQDMMLSGGTESVLCSLPDAAFASMKALSKREVDPGKASCPFDSARDGFVLGEGAGILVLENYDMAVARGARIYAEIVGHGANSDAFHITAPHPEGLGAGACMQLALDSAGIDASEVGYINAHGTSTPLGDIAETKAIKKTFGAHSQNLLISSTKSMIGHLLGAAGGVETIFCVKAVYEGILPPTINLENQDPECDLNYIPKVAVRRKVKYALNNSFGFGGTNSSLIVKALD